MHCLKRYIAELIGTMFLVLFGCGVAVATKCSGNDGIIATSFAFGLSLMAMIYIIGNLSGCHLNPAVSLAFLCQKKLSFKDFIGYVIFQLLGATLGALLVALFFGGFDSLGANQTQEVLISAYGDKTSFLVALLVEIVLTCGFVLVILGVSSKKSNTAISGLIIGLILVVVHLLGIRLTGTSVNPARSFGPALLQAFAGNTAALSQIWIFIVGPFLGALMAVILFKYLTPKHLEE